jgi:hypothetical protein
MGLRGAGARSRKADEQNSKPRPRALPWKKKGLTRVEMDGDHPCRFGTRYEHDDC